MKTLAYTSLLAICVLSPALGQLLDQSSVAGTYGFVQMAADVGGDGALAEVRTLGGKITFDGAGGFTFEGDLGVGAGAATATNGAGTYTVEASGLMTLDDPLGGGSFINARIGEGTEAITGSTTETTNSTQDIFAAVRLPSTATPALVTGDYVASYVAIPAGLVSQARSALIEFTSDAAGGVPAMTVSGHSAATNDAPVNETVTGTTYTLNADGTGEVLAGAGSSLLGANANIFVSETGNYFLGFSTAVAGRVLLFGVRRFGDTTTDADFGGNFWLSEFTLELDRDKYVAGISGIRAASGSINVGRRTKEATATGFGSFDDGLLLTSALDADSTGFFGFQEDRGGNNFAIGAPSGTAAALGVGQGVAPGGFVGAQVGNARLPEVHGIFFGIRMPNIGVVGDVFLSPQGVINAAAFAPTTYPVSPGTLLSLFGAGLAPATTLADAVPLPTTLSGVSVTVNGIAAPLFFVSAGQINIQTPFGLAGDQASIIVTNNGTPSNEVLAPVSPTSPGVFSVNQNGIGHAIVTNAAFQLISETNPAAPGETVIVFLTGLGATNPLVADGAPAPGAEPFARTVDPDISVEFGGEVGTIVFSGAAPNFVGLYQLNVTIPNTVFVGAAIPLAISTGNAFIDYVDIAIGL